MPPTASVSTANLLSAAVGSSSTGSAIPSNTTAAANTASSNSNVSSSPFPPTSLPYSADLSSSSLFSELHRSLQLSSQASQDLSGLLAHRAEIERGVAKAAPALMEAVENALRSHASIAATISTSNHNAQLLSSKVRDLDQIADRVNSALGRVESVLALRHTITRVREKISAGQLLSAADDLHRALFVQTPLENDLSFSLLLELEKKVREEVQKESIQRVVKQGRANELRAKGGFGPLESKEIFRLARMWPKLGYAYRGLVLHCCQVRFECLNVIYKSGWSLENQHEQALVDYARCVGSIIETVNQAIIQHLLIVQSTFGNGSQIRLIQELLANVIDVEVAGKLMNRFIEEKKIKDPKGGTLNPNVDDVISRIKQLNQRVLAANSGSGAAGKDAGASYYHPKDPSMQTGSILHIQSLDELLDEIKFLAHDIEAFLQGMDQLGRQSLDFLQEAANKEKEKRDAAAAQNNKPSATNSPTSSSSSSASSELELKRKEEAFTRFISTPNLSTVPSIHSQHDRVMTIMQKLLQDDKRATNLLEVPLLEERNTFAARPAYPTEGPIPEALLNLPPNSPFLISGFGLDANLATGSKLYDMQLTIIGKYVLIEEFYMNYNVEKALAIDEHDGTSGSSLTDDDAVPTGSQHDDLEMELEAAEQRKEREKAAAAGGLQSLASAISSSSNGPDPYLYLTGIGASHHGQGVPKSFLAKFHTHKTSTLVDNVCFLYKKCLQRALKTSNRDAIYSILLRVHENFNKKLRKVFEGSVAHYESRFGSRKKSSVSYNLFQNPSAYLLSASANAHAGGGGGSAARGNLLGNLIGGATLIPGGSASHQDIRRKINGDVSILLTVNNLDSTIENMMALIKFVDGNLEEMFGEEPANASNVGANKSASDVASSSMASFNRGLSLDQLKEKVYEFHSSFLLFDQLIHRGLQCIAENLWLRLLPRLSLLQTHAMELYVIGDLNAAAADHSDQIISSYMDTFKRDILSLSPVLNENNFYQLVFKVIKLTVRYLENLVLPRQGSSAPDSSPGGQVGGAAAGAGRVLQFTQSGGVQFDKQVRTLTSFFTNDVAAHLERHFADNYFLYLQPLSNAGSAASSSDLEGIKQWRVSFSGSAQARQLFSKLAHVGSILSVDKPAEVLEYTERELFNLKKDEVRRILSLRKEFSEREISQLKL